MPLISFTYLRRVVASPGNGENAEAYTAPAVWTYHDPNEVGYSIAVILAVHWKRRGQGNYMSITVRFFASIRERLGKGEDIIDYKGISTVIDVWNQSAQIPLPVNVLAAVNMEYARPDQEVRDGDEVAFFPPVTGGTQ